MSISFFAAVDTNDVDAVLSQISYNDIEEGFSQYYNGKKGLWTTGEYCRELTLASLDSMQYNKDIEKYPYMWICSAQSVKRNTHKKLDGMQAAFEKMLAQIVETQEMGNRNPKLSVQKTQGYWVAAYGPFSTKEIVPQGIIIANILQGFTKALVETAGAYSKRLKNLVLHYQRFEAQKNYPNSTMTDFYKIQITDSKKSLKNLIKGLDKSNESSTLKELVDNNVITYDIMYDSEMTTIIEWVMHNKMPDIDMTHDQHSGMVCGTGAISFFRRKDIMKSKKDESSDVTFNIPAIEAAGRYFATLDQTVTGAFQIQMQPTHNYTIFNAGGAA